MARWDTAYSPEGTITKENDVFAQVQFIKENDQDRFAVIPIDDYLFLKELLNDEEKLANYLDYLHMQNVKATSNERLSLAEVKQALALD